MRHHLHISDYRHTGFTEVLLMLAALIVLVFIFTFMKLAGEVREGETRTVDDRILLSMRRVNDPALPIGPVWLREAAIDITSLGSTTVLVLVIGASIGLMWILKRYRIILWTLIATIAGTLICGLLKFVIHRQRPTVVPHLREVTSPSFPSGHAMLSAIVYLSLGILLMQIIPGRLAKLYCLLLAMLVTFLVGISRIYLGVHYPTDVLAGWIAGMAWALVCWIVLQVYGTGNGDSSFPPHPSDKH